MDEQCWVAEAWGAEAWAAEAWAADAFRGVLEEMFYSPLLLCVLTSINTILLYLPRPATSSPEQR